MIFRISLTFDYKKMNLVSAYETQIKKNRENVHIGGKSRKGIILPNLNILYENVN